MLHYYLCDKKILLKPIFPLNAERITKARNSEIKIVSR